MSKQKDPILKELQIINKELVAIKKLFILSLYSYNISSEEINKAVKIGSGEIRRMFSKKALKRVKVRAEVINDEK